MSTAPDYNLAGDVPNEAINVRDAKPDIRTAYGTVDAVAQGYDNRSGDLTTLIESAASNNNIVDLGSGTFEMSSTASFSGVGGVVGDGSGLARIHYVGTALDYLFSLNGADTFVLEGVTFDITEDPSTTTDTDVGLASAEVTNETWCDDVVFRGQRHLNQDLDGDGTYEKVGGRFTFLIEMTQTGATGFMRNCHFPDGGTDEHEAIGGTVGHAIGPNADPSHVGLNVWKDCFAQGFMDNGFYVNNSPGRNVLWNCHAKDNAAGNMRLGENDIVVGGLAEVHSLPAGRLGQPLTVNGGSNVYVIGLQIEASGSSYGNEAIQIRSDAQEVTLDRVSVHTTGGNRPVRLSSTGYVTVTVKDVYWYDEASTATHVQIYDAGVTAKNGFRVKSDNAAEIELQSSAELSIDGRSIAPGTYTAEELGLADPQPLPTYHFDGVESGGGTNYPGSGGTVDGSGSPGSRWRLATERTVVIDTGTIGTVSVVVEPQDFS